MQGLTLKMQPITYSSISGILMKHAVLLACALALGGAAHAATVSATIGQSALTYENYDSGSLVLLQTAPLSNTFSSPDSLSLNELDFSPTAIVTAGPRVNADAVSSKMYAETSLDRTGSAWSSVSWQEEGVNSSGMTQALSMDVNLSQMSLNVGGATNDYTQRRSSASFLAEVMVNGTTVWFTQYALTYNGLQRDAILTQSGEQLDNTVLALSLNEKGGGEFDPLFIDNSSAKLSLSEYFGTTVDLGTFADGETYSITYTLSANVTFSDPGSCFYECSGAGVRLRDAIGSVSSLTATPVAAVPEPQTYLLMGFGLLAIGATARRRNLQA